MVISYVPKGYWAAGTGRVPFGTIVDRFVDVDQLELSIAMDNLLTKNYSETKTITRDQEIMSVFHHEDFGWHIFVTNIKAPQ